MIGSFLLLILFIIFFLKDNVKGVVVLVVISLLNDMFKLSAGFSLPLHFIIALVYIPKILMQYKFISYRNRWTLQPLYIEFLYLAVLAFLFGYIIPWQSEYDFERSWSQKAEGRAIVQTIRLVAEFALILILLLWLNTKRITIDYLLKTISIIIFASLTVSLTDTMLSGSLKQMFFPEARILGDRFSGFNGEPRAFGRVCSIVLLFLVSFYNLSKKDIVIKMGLWSAIIGLAISMSASAYLMTLAWGGLFVIVTGRFRYFVAGIALVTLSLFFLNQNEFFRESTLTKIENTVSEGDDYYSTEKVSPNEPDIFSSFEVFDRAALNFLYEDSFFLITGTGPNMISIPSSPYLTASTYAVYENRIDSVPHSFLVNLIARSGLVGLALWFIFIMRFTTTLKGYKKELLALFMCIVLANFIVNASIFFLVIAVLLHITGNIKGPKKEIYD